jgi:cytochrome c oxidase cbb3-type subunit 1
VNPALAAAVRRHSLAWLVAANAVGALLAALLLWPDANDWLVPFTYGRWVPLHLNWQLYGWCAVPLVGVLLAHCLPADHRALAPGRLALAAWSGALSIGGASWLAGRVSGKLFLDWVSPAREIWAAAGLVLWVVLVTQAWRRGGLAWWVWALLLILGAVPGGLYWSADPAVYPAVNPHSGGATGASLLGSTLGVVAIFGLLPWLLRVPPAGPTWPRRVFVATFALSIALYAGIGHSDASHHRPDQLVGLGSLLVWLPVIRWYAGSFAWAENSRIWLRAAFVWWCLLVTTGWLAFLPGISEQLKFTNALVAHSHLAMAGLVTSLHVAILLNLAPARAPAPTSFWLWQLGCAVHVGVLLWLGWHEAETPTLLQAHGGLADVCYGLRLVAGLAMLAASIHWLVVLWRHESPAS